jgi:hypothetical protein
MVAVAVCVFDTGVEDGGHHEYLTAEFFDIRTAYMMSLPSAMS